MAKKPITVLKEYFKANKRPTESQFGDLIDSYVHLDSFNPNGYLPLTGGTINGAITMGNATNWVINKDLSTITIASGFARDIFRLTGSNGIIDVLGWQGSVDSTGKITLGYGFLGGTAYNTKNAIRWTPDQRVLIGGTGLPSGTYALDIVGDALVRGATNTQTAFNSTTGELLVQRSGVNRIRTGSNALILSADTPTGIIYLRPQGDLSGGGQVVINPSNTAFVDNYNLLFGNQTAAGSAIFHTGLSVGTGYGMWMAHNVQFNGTDFIQPRGTLASYAFTANIHKGFSFNFAGPTGTNGAVAPLTEVAKIDGTGKITTLNHGDSSQWNSAFQAMAKSVATNTAQDVSGIKNFTTYQKFLEGIKFFDGATPATYLRKFINRASWAIPVTTTNGNIKVTFPSTMAGTMWSLTVKVVQYTGTTVNDKTWQIPMTVTISGYNGVAGSTNVNFGATCLNEHSNFIGVRTGIDSSNNKIIWLDFNAALSYPKVIVEEFLVHHSGAISTTHNNNFTIDITADETGYTNQTTLLLTDFKNNTSEAAIAVWNSKFPTNHAGANNAATYSGNMLTMPGGNYSAAVSSANPNLPYTLPGGLISFGQLAGISGRILSPRDNTDNWFFQSGDGTGTWKQFASREWVLAQLTAETNTLTRDKILDNEPQIADILSGRIYSTPPQIFEIDSSLYLEIDNNNAISVVGEQSLDMICNILQLYKMQNIEILNMSTSSTIELQQDGVFVAIIEAMQGMKVRVNNKLRMISIGTFDLEEL